MYFSIILGYLLGSLPFSYLVPKLFKGIDIRKFGSGNVGATNVFRACGLPLALLAFLGDLTKGLIAALLSIYFWNYDAGLLAAIAAMIGHCYTFFLNFKGGKGVATFGGLVLILDPLIFAILITVELILIFSTRIVSLASIISATLLPIVAILLGRSQNFVLFCLTMSLLVIFQHRSNIKRLIDGTEKKLK